MSLKLKLAAQMAAFICASGFASAHTSYMLPSTFNMDRGSTVTLQCSFSEDFSGPEIAVLSDDYHVVHPDGARADFDTLTPFKQLVVMEQSLEREGTYRFTTGQRLGRKSRRALVDGEWKPIFGPNAEVPENASEVISTQTATVADVYVSKGAPTWPAVEATIGRLVFTPQTHPNEIFVDEPFDLNVSFDGEPMAQKEMTLYRHGGAYDDRKFRQTVTTDDAGDLALTFDQAGIYLVMTRHRAPAPEGAETDERGYTTSLTFEVMK